jgi:hypothetical protein
MTMIDRTLSKAHRWGRGHVNSIFCTLTLIFAAYNFYSGNILWGFIWATLAILLYYSTMRGWVFGLRNRVKGVWRRLYGHFSPSPYSRCPHDSNKDVGDTRGSGKEPLTFGPDIGGDDWPAI